MGYSPLGRRESDMTKHTHTLFPLEPLGEPEREKRRQMPSSRRVRVHRPLMMKPQEAGPLADGARHGSAEPASHVPGACLQGGERRAVPRLFLMLASGNTRPSGTEPPLG